MHSFVSGFFQHTGFEVYQSGVYLFNPQPFFQKVFLARLWPVGS